MRILAKLLANTRVLLHAVDLIEAGVCQHMLVALHVFLKAGSRKPQARNFVIVG